MLERVTKIKSNVVQLVSLQILDTVDKRNRTLFDI